jgi:hypothetical protein
MALEARGVSLAAIPANAGGPLPEPLKAGVESLSGLAMDDVRVHRDSSEPERLGALAYAQGSDIHLAPGEDRHLPHEAWHVAQQKQGRVRPGAGAGAPLNADSSLEVEADLMGQRAVETGSGGPARPGPLANGRATAAVQCRAGKRRRKQAAPAVRRDRAVDVIEAVVNMMSNRGLAGNFGPMGENISSPRYASEVAKTVLEPDHVALIWTWYRIATGDPATRGDRARIAGAAAATAPLLAEAQADPSARERAAALARDYSTGLEELSQRAAREQVDEMLDRGNAASMKAEASNPAAGDDQQLRTAILAAQKLMGKWVSAVRRTTSGFTSARQKNELQALVYRRSEESFRRAVEAGADPPLPWPEAVKRASGMKPADGIFLLQGALDAANAIMAVSDPKARAALFSAKSTYVGTVAQGATINKVLWQFVSGTIAAAGAGAYAVAKLAGKASVADGILDATVRGVSNVGAAINLAGVIHGGFVLADPDSTPDEKAEAAVEIAYSAVGLTGFAARWVPRLAGAARWSGPISASLTINFQMVKWLAGTRLKAQIGLNRLDWVSCHKAARKAAIEVQDLQRRLAVADAILATETDARRQVELQKYAQAFRWALIEQGLKPFVEARLASTGMDDDSASCGRAFARRLEPVQAMLGSASSSDEAALSASATFLLIVDKAFAEWDQIVMETDSP